MLIGYARVSTVGQSYEAQQEKLQQAGCQKIFVEKVTGTNRKKRDQLDAAIEFAREGDTLVITKIDRLARSIIDLNNIVKELNDKGIGVRFLDGNMEFMPNGTGNELQMLLFNVLGSFAQFERDIIVGRTTEGRERAKRQGKHLGRPSQPEHEIKRALQLYAERESNGNSVSDIVKLTGVPKSTIYAEIKKRQAKDN